MRLLLGLMVQGEVLMHGVHIDGESGCSFIALSGQEFVLFSICVERSGIDSLKVHKDSGRSYRFVAVGSGSFEWVEEALIRR